MGQACVQRLVGGAAWTSALLAYTSGAWEDRAEWSARRQAILEVDWLWREDRSVSSPVSFLILSDVEAVESGIGC